MSKSKAKRLRKQTASRLKLAARLLERNAHLVLTAGKTPVRRGYTKPENAPDLVAVEEHLLEHRDHKFGVVPASIGCAVFDCDSDDADLTDALQGVLTRFFGDAVVAAHGSNPDQQARRHFILPVDLDDSQPIGKRNWRAGEIFVHTQCVVAHDVGTWNKLLDSEVEPVSRSILLNAMRRLKPKKIAKLQMIAGGRNDNFFQVACDYYHSGGGRGIDELLQEFIDAGEKHTADKREREGRATLASAKERQIEQLGDIRFDPDDLARMHDYVYSMVEDRVIHTQTLERSKTEAFTKSMYITGETFKSLHEAGVIKNISGVDFRPGKPQFFEHPIKPDPMLNAYRPPEPHEASDEAHNFYDEMVVPLARFLCGDDDAALLLRWITAVVTPEDRLRIGWAVLLHGPKGVGKSTLAVLVRALVGDLNCYSVNAAQAIGRFNDWAEARRFIEIRELDFSADTRQNDVDSLNSMLTDKKFSIEAKHQAIREATFRGTIMGATNKARALSLHHINRRWWVVSSGPGDLPRTKVPAYWKEHWKGKKRYRKIDKFFRDFYDQYETLAPQLVTVFRERNKIAKLPTDAPATNYQDELYGYEEENTPDWEAPLETMLTKQAAVSIPLIKRQVHDEWIDFRDVHPYLKAHGFKQTSTKIQIKPSRKLNRPQHNSKGWFNPDRISETKAALLIKQKWSKCFKG